MPMPVRSLYTDAELLSHIAAGDERAFSIAYEQYRGKIYATAYHTLRSEVLAEEVLQEVMLKLWLNAGQLQADSRLEPYLKTLTRNLSFNYLRRQAVEAKANLARGVSWTELHNETEERILLGEAKKILQEAIDRLPAQQRQVYQLCHQEGLKYDEAAREMNLSTETVRSYMKLALRSLRQYISLHSDLATMLFVVGMIGQFRN